MNDKQCAKPVYWKLQSIAEIQQDLNINTKFVDQKIQHSDANSLQTWFTDLMQAQSKFQQVSFFFVNMDKLILKCTWKCKEPRIAKQLCKICITKLEDLFWFKTLLI